MTVHHDAIQVDDVDGAVDELQAEVGDVAAIAPAAMSVDDSDRQRRDHAARESRRRLHRLGRD